MCRGNKSICAFLVTQPGVGWGLGKESLLETKQSNALGESISITTPESKLTCLSVSYILPATNGFQLKYIFPDSVSQGNKQP